MIHITDLTKTFINEGKELKVLDHINLHVAKRDILGIIGISGAGKSTLLRCIGCLEEPTSGSIIIDNQEVAHLSPKEKIDFYKELGTVFQGYNLMMQKTVAKNIALPLEISKVPKAEIESRVKELLTLVGLEDKANIYPSKLSGGQKQRVAIARALANHPKILLCDEPTSALDSLTTRAILNLLKDINEKLGVTIVIITHDIDVVKTTCNKVVVLDQSQLIEQGLTQEVFEAPKSHITQRFLA
ncbi:MAG: methionine ABC transporter ATP-binding protein [Cellulosilyticaceae bacterium]